jgi:thioredoxin
MQEIKSISHFNKLKTNPLLIIDFYAVWCGPCKVISPAFDRLAKQHEGSTSIIFAKVDVDKAKDVAQACGITAMPTFQFFKNGTKVDEVKGADMQQLSTKIGYYTSAATKDNAGQGAKAGESKTNTSKPATTRPSSLRSLISIPNAKLFGASNLSSVTNIASPPVGGYAVASASGSRVLVYMPFTQSVTPSNLRISMIKDSISSAPSRIQIGTNVPVCISKSEDGVETSDLDFDSLAKAENSQSFNIYSDEYNNGTTELKLKASKFTSVKSLTIRIDANISEDAKTITKIKDLDVIGSIG